jgi:predicted metal-dependent HD superfamily phosphohydrolase
MNDTTKEIIFSSNQDELFKYSQYRKVDLDIESIVNCMIWIEDNVIDFRTKDNQIKRMKFSETSLKKLLLVISTYLSRDDK